MSFDRYSFRGNYVHANPSARCKEDLFEQQLHELTVNSSRTNKKLDSLFKVPMRSISTDLSMIGTEMTDLSTGELERLENSIIDMHQSRSDSVDSTISSGLRFYEIVSLTLSVLIIIFTFPLSILVCCRSIRVYERMVILRMGRLINSNPVGPGLAFVLPCIDKTVIIDLRLDFFTFDSTDIMLQDSIQVNVNAVVWYRIVDPVAAVTAVENYEYTTKLLTEGVIRRFLGYKSLDQVVRKERKFIHEIIENINYTSCKFGVVVERVELRSIKLEKRFERIIAAEGTAYATAKSRLIAAKGELKAAPMLARAGQSYNKTCLQIRYMQTLNSIQSKTDLGSTLLYPIPLYFGFKELREHNRKIQQQIKDRTV